MDTLALTWRQRSVLESVVCGEVGYCTHFGGFYYNRVLEFELEAVDKQFLRGLQARGLIFHKSLAPFDFEVLWGQPSQERASVSSTGGRQTAQDMTRLSGTMRSGHRTN